MLAKILAEMWVEPEVLEALNEEQKRILFLKMREEQVRRWTEREEKEEKERGDVINSRPKKASSKQVRWLLGRDGDISVSVIGEVDMITSSQLLRSLRNNRLHNDNMNGIQTAHVLPGREAQELGFRKDTQLPLTDVGDYLGSPIDQSSEEDGDSCSADDDLKDPAEMSDSDSGNSSDNLSDWDPHYNPSFSRHGELLKGGRSGTERAEQHDRGPARRGQTQSEHRGRVAQLRKAFSEDHHRTTPAYSKPPLPAKPAHLHNTSMSLVH